MIVLTLGCCLAVGSLAGKWLIFGSFSDFSRLFKPVAISSKDNKVVKAFLAAESLIPNWNQGIYPPVHNWDQTIKLNNGLSFCIRAYQCVGGRFEGKFSDEPEFKTIADPGDYVYPCDIRINIGTGYLFCKASGLAAGLYQETVIYQFDLNQRRVVQRVVVDPVILPGDPKPVTSSPSKPSANAGSGNI